MKDDIRETLTAPRREDRPLTERLVEEFGAFGPAYMRWLHGCRPEGASVSYPRMKLMAILLHQGPQIMSQVSDRLGVTPRNVTALVDALEHEGLVRRRPHPTDRRATYLELSPHGEDTIRRGYAGHVAGASELFAELPEEDQHELLRLIGGLRAELDRRNAAGHVTGRFCP